MDNPMRRPRVRAGLSPFGRVLLAGLAAASAQAPAPVRPADAPPQPAPPPAPKPRLRKITDEDLARINAARAKRARRNAKRAKDFASSEAGKQQHQTGKAT